MTMRIAAEQLCVDYNGTVALYDASLNAIASVRDFANHPITCVERSQTFFQVDRTIDFNGGSHRVCGVHASA